MRALLLGLVLAAPALAGCLGPDAVPETVTSASDANVTAPDTTLPDGREFAAAKETNRTEEGVGGVDHRHDYWKGATQDVVFDGLVYFSAAPVFPDGEGTSAKSVAYVKLPTPKLVYEGAALVQVVATPAGLGVDRDLPTAPHPAAPKLSLQYRTAADAEWREPLALAYDQPLDLTLGERESDMPHSVRSLWVFRVTTDTPVEGYIAKLTITAHKGADVVSWPGHPEFYAERATRIVLDREVTTHMSGVMEGLLYDSGGTWVAPDKLISHGTKRLEVFVNVTSIKSQTGQTATGYFLESHNATDIGPEIRFGDRWSDRSPSADLESWNFTIPVMLDGMDGPYQPHSRWGFRAMATFADVDFPTGGGIGLCPACFAYDITYRIVVVAVGEAGAKMGA